MRVASNAFMETIIEDKADVNRRLRFFPNPYAANPKFADDSSLLPMLKQWRIPLLKSTHVMVAFDGGMGTKAEIEVALDLGCIVIPFFKDESKETWQLIGNNLIAERLVKYDPDYISQMGEKNIKYKDVLNLIEKVFK